MSTIFDNEVTVWIDGKRFRYWSRISFSRSIDAIDVIEIEGPFDPDNEFMASTFVPLSYKPFSALINDEPVFDGTMVPVNPRVTPEKTEVAAGAYSLPGILGECSQSLDSATVEFKNQNLAQIARALTEPFDIWVDMREDPGKPFKKVAIKPAEKILPFLVKLAKQRNLVITNSEVGDLVFWRSIESGDPVAVLEQGMSPLLGVQPAINPQEFYSEITGVKKIRPRSKSSVQFTVSNPLLTNVFRPYVFSIPDTEDTELEAAVEAKASRMYANAIAYSAEVATWRDAYGNLWAPNTIVRLRAPGAMIYNFFDFVIRSVKLSKDSKKETASLDLMVPGSFGDIEPGGLPWAR